MYHDGGALNCLVRFNRFYMQLHLHFRYSYAHQRSVKDWIFFQRCILKCRVKRIRNRTMCRDTCWPDIQWLRSQSFLITCSSFCPHVWQFDTCHCQPSDGLEFIIVENQRFYQNRELDSSFCCKSLWKRLFTNPLTEVNIRTSHSKMGACQGHTQGSQQMMVELVCAEVCTRFYWETRDEQQLQQIRSRCAGKCPATFWKMQELVLHMYTWWEVGLVLQEMTSNHMKSNNNQPQVMCERRESIVNNERGKSLLV